MSHDLTAFPLEQLPDKVQSLVCSLASTPSCPGHILLSLVSKTWAEKASWWLQLDGASIVLELTCGRDSPVEQQDREEQRLVGLADWVLQHGHLLIKFSIQTKPPQEWVQEYVVEACQATPEVVAALAAAGRRPGGLQRLQQLRLPAFPGTPLPTICRAVSGCRHLRDLHLGNCYSNQTIKSSWRTHAKLAAALQQLTQLTSLKLEGGLFHYCDVRMHSIDIILTSLPSTLEVLQIEGHYPGPWVPHVQCSTSSLQHLVALRHLTLPDYTHISSSSSSSSNVRGGSEDGGQEDSGDPLAALTALTYLDCFSAVKYQDAPLLALPNLVELRAGVAMPCHLETLANRAALRNLTVWLDPHLHSHMQTADALEQLTNITALSLYVQDELPDMGLPHDIAEAAQLAAVALLAEAAAGLGRAVATLTGLRQLRLQPLILSMVDLSSLTALTRLDVAGLWREEWDNQEQVTALLQCLAPARGQLQALQLLGLFTGLQEGCRAAVAAVLGEVELTFAQP
jgi:hypothetical protein